MHFLFFALKHFLVVGAFAFVAYLVGRRMLRSVELRSPWEDIALSTGLGLGAFGTAIFFLGETRALYWWAFVALCIIAAVAFRREAASLVMWWQTLADRFRERSRGDKTVIVAIASTLMVFAVLVWIVPLYPPRLWDALSYHLPSARLYAENHRLLQTPYLRACVSNQQIEMLFAAMFLVSDAVAAQLIHYILMFLTGILIVAFGIRYFSFEGGILAALLWYASPEVLVTAGNGYIDAGVAFFVIATIFAFANWLESDDEKWLLIAGISGGFAAGAKYNALFFLMVLTLYLIYRGVRTRTVRPVLLFLVPSVVIFLPWAAHNFYYTGNPLFPYMTEIFGTGCWTPLDAIHVKAEWARLGTPRTLLSLLHLPLNLTFHQELFLIGGGKLSPLLFGAFPLAFVAGLRTRAGRLILFLTLSYIVFWFFTVQVPRYLWPVLPLLALLETSTVVWLIATLVRKRWTLEVILTSIVALAIMFQPMVVVRGYLKSIGLPATDKRENDIFFERFDQYRCYDWLNRHYGRNYRIFSLDANYLAYFAEGTRIGDVLGPGLYKQVDLHTGKSLAQSLDKLGAEFFLTESDNFYGVPPSDQFFNQHFRLVCGCSGTRVWQKSSTAATKVLGAEELKNGTFENPRDSIMWALSPSALLDLTGRNSHRGAGTALVRPEDILFQEVPIHPDTLHDFTIFARADHGTAKVRMVFEWFGPNKLPLGGDAESFTVKTGWQQIEMPVRSDYRATTVKVHPLVSDAPVWFDDASMKPITYHEVHAAGTASLVGIYRPEESAFFLKTSIGGGFANLTFNYGSRGDLPVAGDWNADGVATVGVYVPSTGEFLLRNENTPGEPDIRFHGIAGGVPVVGDWNGDGVDDVAVFDPQHAVFVLYDVQSPTHAQTRIAFGQPGDIPLAGDWNGNGIATVGVFRPSTATFILASEDRKAKPLYVTFGATGDLPLAGDWDGDGVSTIGVFRPTKGVFLIKNELEAGKPDRSFTLGRPGDLPIVWKQ